jgi:hypothetical protein
MQIKPQDVVVLLKLTLHPNGRPPFVQLALDLGMSASEVHAAVRRLRAARLLHAPDTGDQPILYALQEFLIHGLKYVFPADRGELTRGVPTSYAAEPLRSLIAQGSEPPPVWPCAEGTARGLSFSPLYKTVPQAALRDVALYELLALADALRDGRTRERKLAEQELISRLHSERSLKV